MGKYSKILAILIILLNTPYIIWLVFNISGVFGWLLFFAELMMLSLSFLFFINHWEQKHIKHPHHAPKGSLDIFLTVVNEPVELFEETLKATQSINYENKKIYILDDGPRGEIRNLTFKYRANYLSREDKSHRKAGNLNFGLNHSAGEFILVLDADQIPKPEIANDLLGYFSEDPKLALITTRQSFKVPKADFNHDVLFYEHMQSGKNADNASISCGSGVFYRRSALEAVGGFLTWNVVEDLTTTYYFHLLGYATMYINKPYAEGVAPYDLSTIYKQRGTWALDTLRLFIWKNPFAQTNLTFKQKLHYTELCWVYIVSAVALPILFLLPLFSLLFNIHFIDNEKLYLLFRIPSLLLILYFYYYLSGKCFSSSQFWAALSFVYFKALILAAVSTKINYKVTNKMAGVGKRDIALILPHLLFIAAGLIIVFWRIFIKDHSLSSFTLINSIWIGLMAFWFYPLIKKGFILE